MRLGANYFYFSPLAKVIKTRERQRESHKVQLAEFFLVFMSLIRRRGKINFLKKKKMKIIDFPSSLTKSKEKKDWMTGRWKKQCAHKTIYIKELPDENLSHTHLPFIFLSLSLPSFLFVFCCWKNKTTQKLQQAASSKRGTRTETCSFTTSGWEREDSKVAIYSTMWRARLGNKETSCWG